MAYKQSNYENEAKYNAGLDAEKRIMELLRDIDRMSLLKEGNAQEAKYTLIKQLSIAVRGMFNSKEIRASIWEQFIKINLRREQVVIKQGKTKNMVVYDPIVDAELDVLLMSITDYLQDDRGFFSPSKGVLSNF